MTFDPSKLTTAPWIVHDNGENYWCGPPSNPLLEAAHDDRGRVAVEFAALARNAFDVMMRRGWGVRLTDVCPIAGKIDLQWQAIVMCPGSVVGINSMIYASDPFTALVEADRWYKENMEKEAPVQ